MDCKAAGAWALFLLVLTTIGLFTYHALQFAFFGETPTMRAVGAAALVVLIGILWHPVAKIQKALREIP